MNYILLVVGFYVLIKSADFMIDGAISIAKKLKISTLAIGLTVVAFGTSAPEIFVSITSAIKGSTDLALGNIIGSNIANVALILGVSAFLFPIKAKHSTIYKEIPFCLLISFALFFLIDDAIFASGASNGNNILVLGDSLILLLFFLIFCVYTYGIMGTEKDKQTEEDFKEMGLNKSILYIVGGIIFLAVSSKIVIDSASNIASSLGISQTIIGLTVVALGTSLPELVTSIIASLKRNSDLVLGNIVGSNIINITLGLGLTGLVEEIYVQKTDLVYIYFELFISSLLILFLFLGNSNGKLKRWHGTVFLTLYIAFIMYIAILNLPTVQ